MGTTKSEGKSQQLKDWPAATSDKKDSAMIGGVANGRPLTRNGKKGGKA